MVYWDMNSWIFMQNLKEALFHDSSVTFFSDRVQLNLREALARWRCLRVGLTLPLEAPMLGVWMDYQPKKFKFRPYFDPARCWTWRLEKGERRHQTSPQKPLLAESHASHWCHFQGDVHHWKYRYPPLRYHCRYKFNKNTATAVCFYARVQ